MRAVLTGR